MPSRVLARLVLLLGAGALPALALGAAEAQPRPLPPLRPVTSQKRDLPKPPKLRRAPSVPTRAVWLTREQKAAAFTQLAQELKVTIATPEPDLAQEITASLTNPAKAGSHDFKVSHPDFVQAMEGRLVAEGKKPMQAWITFRPKPGTLYLVDCELGLSSGASGALFHVGIGQPGVGWIPVFSGTTQALGDHLVFGFVSGTDTELEHWLFVNSGNGDQDWWITGCVLTPK